MANTSVELLTNVYLSLGSNRGDRNFHIQQAIKLLQRPKVTIPIAVSPLYETEPWGNPQQPWFLNCVLRLKTNLKPYSLFKRLKAIEGELGRPPDSAKWAPRAIDLDILIYGKQLINTKTLKIPHPLMSQRRFVLQPLADLEGELIIPGLNQTVNELLAVCPDAGRVELFAGELCL